MHARTLLFLLLLWAGLALIGCSNNLPNMGPACWYRGSATVDSAGASVFGPGGDVAIEWQRIPAQGVWIWRENRANGWNAQTVWQAEAPPNFSAMISTGAWEGTVVVEDWQSSSVYTPGGWTYSLVLTDKNGTIVGNGDVGDDGGEGGDAPNPVQPFVVWIKLKWLRPDGSVAATMSETLTACNEEEYLNAVTSLGGTAAPR